MLDLVLGTHSFWCSSLHNLFCLCFFTLFIHTQYCWLVSCFCLFRRLSGLREELSYPSSEVYGQSYGDTNPFPHWSVPGQVLAQHARESTGSLHVYRSTFVSGKESAKTLSRQLNYVYELLEPQNFGFAQSMICQVHLRKLLQQRNMRDIERAIGSSFW